MSQTSQDIATPTDPLMNALSHIIIVANDEVSKEKLLQDLNLPVGLRERIDVQSKPDGSNRRRFVIKCPDYWAWDQVLQSACLLGQGYHVSRGLTSSRSSPGSVGGGSPDGRATPTSGLTPGPSTFGTVLNTPAFPSPWGTQAANSLQSPIWDVQGSPFFTQASGNFQETPPVFSEATPSIPTPSSVFQSSAGVFKQKEASDDDRDLFAVAEGEEEYVQEWDGRDADMTQGEEEEDGESSPSGESSFKCQGGGIPAHHYRGLDHYPDPEADGPTTSVTNTDEEEEENMTSDNTGGPDSDQEMTEEEETEAIVEEPMTSGYEADHSESDAPRSPRQRRQATPHPRAPLSPSDLRAISETPSTTANAPHPRAVLSPSDLVDTPPTTGNAGTAEIDPPASQSTTRGTNNVLGPLLDSTEDELMGDAAKASEVDGLINGLSGLALPPPDQVQPAPSSQSGQTTTPGEGLQDSPDTSAESEVLRGMVERSLAGTLGVDYIKVMAPAGHGGTGFVEVRRE